MKLGVVCGLADERRVIEERENGAAALIAVTGADPARATVLARKLLADGATHLVSFGLAGGLDPALDPGALVISHRVVTPEGVTEGDSAWADAMIAEMRAAEINAHAETVYGAALPVLSPEQKAGLFAQSGAAIVDMESGAVAQVAAAARASFVVVRAVADDAGSTVPSYASDAIEEDGSADVLSVLGGLALDPLSLPRLIGVAAGAHRAYATLREAAPFIQVPPLQQ